METMFDVVISREKNGGYVAFVPELPGCHTQAETMEELEKNINEAIELYLETLSGDEKREILKSKTSFVEVKKVKVHA